MAPDVSKFAATDTAWDETTTRASDTSPTHTTSPRALKRQHLEINGSNGGSEVVQGSFEPSHLLTRPLQERLAGLYAESVTAKIWNTAAKALGEESPPTQMPQYTEPGGTAYVHSPAEFWTSGFFAGCIAALRQRRCRWRRHPLLSSSSTPHELELQHACRWWSDALHAQAERTDEHDLGFMIQPWAQPLWEFDGDKRAFGSLIKAAMSLARRFDPRVGAIRSWDTCFTKRYRYDDPTTDFLVIIDSMMNINLLFYVADQVGDERLWNIAKTHALTLMKSHVRNDYSTCHVVNFDQHSGLVKERITNQGFSDDSCWTRGQAWAITGYAQTYGWTHDKRFLDMSCRLADHYIAHLSEDKVPIWDFSAPLTGPKDSSSAMIAAYGMLVLHGYVAYSTAKYLDAAVEIVDAVLKTSKSPDARFRRRADGKVKVENVGEESILLHATINNYDLAPRQWADHGLVYADYYFLLIGNQLLEMGLV